MSKCDICGKIIEGDDYHNDESGICHIACYEKWFRYSAIEAGIPASVVDGKTKLTDHFSQEYIDSQCGRDTGIKMPSRQYKKGHGNDNL